MNLNRRFPRVSGLVLLGALTLAACGAPNAAPGVSLSRQAVGASVSFSVNLDRRIAEGGFTPGTDTASVVGNFAGGSATLSDPDGDHIYTGTVQNLSSDAQITYNFRLTRGGTAVNERVPARKYVVQPTSSANTVEHWFDDALPAYPYAKFFASSTKTIPGEVIRFFDSSEGGAATSWNWSFPGATPGSSSAQNPTVTYSAPGTYTATLTARNASGQTTTRALSITVTSVDSALGWWNDAVFYQVYPRSYLDTNGDGVGDLPGLIGKLDYLKDLGVTALYVMPVHPASSIYYGGYEVKDYKGIADELGSQAQFDELVSGAHARGMRVIMDMVFNHTSDEHPWFQSAAKGAGGQYDDFYVWRQNNPGSAWRINTVQHSNAKFDNYWGKFAVKTPDLNFYNPSVRSAVKDVSAYWLGRGADGFRLDAPMFLYERGDAVANSDQEQLPATYAYWREWRSFIKSVKPDAFSVGETWIRNQMPDAAKYVYQGFDIGFQFDVAYGVQNSLNSENKNELQGAVEQSMSLYPFLQFGTFLSNHDLYKAAPDYTPQRIRQRLEGNRDAKAKVAAAWLLTAPGVPFVYYGDEVGAAGQYSRKPMQWTSGQNAGFTTGTPWEALPDDAATYNVQVEQNDPNSFLNLYKKLIAVRKAEVALRRGSYQSVNTSSSSVYAYLRRSGTEAVVVLLNLSSSAQSGVALSVGGTGIAGGTYTLNTLAGTGGAANVTVSGGTISGWVPFASLPANSFAVLKLGDAGAPPTPTGAACFYPDPNFGGTPLCADTDSAWVGNAWNDRISSVKVQSGYQVQLFGDINYGGTVKTLTADAATLAEFDNLASSFKVGKLPPPTSGGSYYIVDRWKGNYLYDNQGRVLYQGAPSGTNAQWTLESVNGNTRIRNVGTGGYMNIEQQQNWVESSAVPDFFTSGQWTLEQVDGYTRLRNVWKGIYAHVEGQTGFLQTGALDPSFYSSQWRLQAVK